jgi:glycosyltransferase 2 family protein
VSADEGRSIGARIPGILNVLLKLVISGGLLAYLVTESNVSTFSDAMRQADLALFVLAIGFFVLSNALGAGQWYLLLRGQDLDIGKKQAVIFYWVGVFFNNVLLGNIGGDALRIYDIRRLTGSSRRGAAATVMDRFIGLFSTCTLALAAWALLAEVRVVSLITVLGPVWLGLAILLAAGLSRRFGSRLQSLADRLLPERGARIFADARDSVFVYRQRTRLLALAWVISLGVQFSRILVYWTAGLAVGLEMSSLPYFIGFQPLAAVIAALPISIGGLGVRESVLVELFGRVGIVESQAFALSLLGYGAGIAASLLGGVAFILRRVQPVEDTEEGTT